MIAVKILVCIGIIACISLLQIAENKALGLELRREATPVAFLKFGFLVFLIWKWVSTWGF